MSQTYAHYSTPSSLPSDYAVLSRYATHNDTHGVNGESRHDEADLTETEDEAVSEIDSSSGRHRNALSRPLEAMGRRQSFPTSYIPSFKPTVGPLPNKSGYRSGPPGPDDASENTPLLAPLVPRIEEDVDRADPADDESTSSMLKEEVKILAKYTLPVFGCVVLNSFYTSFVDPALQNTHLGVLARYCFSGVPRTLVHYCSCCIYPRIYDGQRNRI